MEYQSIRLLILDVDGVLTDGTVLLDGDGGELQRFSIQDGLGIRLWRQAGGKAAIWSARTSGAVRQRAKQFGIDLIEQGRENKLAAYESILRKTGFSDAEASVMGDDLLDGPAMRRCGLAIAPANAVEEIKQIAAHVTSRRGGQGAVRQAVEFLLKNQGRWEETLHRAGF